MFYTYLIGWRTLDVWYYGYKTGSTDSLWTSYFTSSKYVKEFRELHGEPDVVLVHKTFESKACAQAYEDRFQRRVDAVRSPRWLNRSRAGKEFRGPDRYSEESKKKMSQSARARLAQSPKVVTDAMREAARKTIMRVNEMGLRRKWTDEQRLEVAERLGGPVRLGMKNAPEHNAKISASAQERPRLCCTKCKKEVVVNAFYQHKVKCDRQD